MSLRLSCATCETLSLKYKNEKVIKLYGQLYTNKLATVVQIPETHTQLSCTGPRRNIKSKYFCNY
jgi:hypothetical protein